MQLINRQLNSSCTGPARRAKTWPPACNMTGRRLAWQSDGGSALEVSARQWRESRSRRDPLAGCSIPFFVLWKSVGEMAMLRQPATPTVTLSMWHEVELKTRITQT